MLKFQECAPTPTQNPDCAVVCYIAIIARMESLNKYEVIKKSYTTEQFRAVFTEISVCSFVYKWNVNQIISQNTNVLTPKLRCRTNCGLTSTPVLMYTHVSLPNKIWVPFIDVSTACSLTIYIHRMRRRNKKNFWAQLQTLKLAYEHQWLKTATQRHTAG